MTRQEQPAPEEAEQMALHEAGHAAVVAMAGREARRLKYPSDADWDWLEMSDRNQALRLLRPTNQKLVDAAREDETLLSPVVNEARRLMIEHQSALEALVARLTSRGFPTVVEGLEAEIIIGGARRPPQL
jgi:hypothetical protein